MGLGKTLTVISLLATNAPGALLPPVTYISSDGTQAVAPSATAANGPAGSSSQAPPPKKRRKKGEPAASQAAGSSMQAVSLIQSQIDKNKARLQQIIAAAEPAPLQPVVGGPQGTLIVCPLSVLSNWQTQLGEHTSGTLQVVLLWYHWVII